MDIFYSEVKCTALNQHCRPYRPVKNITTGEKDSRVKMSVDPCKLFSPEAESIEDSFKDLSYRMR